MQTAASAIVVASTVTHAYWNFLLKRAGGHSTIVALSKVAEAVLFAPVFLWMARSAPWSANAIGLMVIGAALVLFNYAALSRAYASGDLSLVYPISRAGILLFLPALGFMVFGERLHLVGWIALASIIAGIVVLQLRAFSLQAVRSIASQFRGAAVAFALLAALFAAAYTVWDKRAVRQVPTFVYFYGYTAIVAAAYVLFLWRTKSAAEVTSAWRTNGRAIVQIGVFNTITYLLVLIALREGTSSYVIALRQLSIVWGALLGYFVLGEALPAPKRAGIAMLVAGCVLVALAN